MTKHHRVPAYDLGHRTPGERLWLARRAAWLTQVQAARLARVGEKAYGDAEKDRSSAVRGPVPGIPAVPRPSLPQLLALARRRSAMDLGEAASLAGCSRVTLLLRERSGSRELKRTWELEGFTFPR